ncbi:dihydrofolate reductase [Candidatus Uhrbacteria bacterium]|nr:dihydrofolate reductase [Candidatus Uhrbacteria bacterium]
MAISLIAAVAKNGCIGKNNQLPWSLPEDLRHFKELTTGHSVLMGRKTWESIPEKFRPLPNRKNIVLTRQEDYQVPSGVDCYTTLDEALRVHQAENIFVIGGAEIYQQALPLAHKLYLTEVDQTIDGDAFFPCINQTDWKETAREPHEGFSFITYEPV